jgi:hypothetical protein
MTAEFWQPQASRTGFDVLLANDEFFGAVLGAVLLAAPAGMLTFGFVTEARGPILGLELVGLTFVAVAVIVATRPVFGRLGQPSDASR